MKAGQTVALVGASGAGKTTLINLIPRFWTPTAGEIYFDGVAQSSVTLRSLRAQISLVSQDVILFDDTIAANIAYGNESATREQIEEAARAAYLMPFIETLPKGLDTLVGEAGNKLSGGQKQRISIARALLKMPQFCSLMRLLVLWIPKVKNTSRSLWIDSCKSVLPLWWRIVFPQSSELTRLL